MKLMFIIMNLILINLSFAEIRIDSDNRVVFDGGSVLKIDGSNLENIRNLNGTYLGQGELEQLFQGQAAERLDAKKPKFILIDVNQVQEIILKDKELVEINQPQF